MPLNKSTGNMYPWITHTWNPIRGRCPHECSYCYMKGKPVGNLRFVEIEMKTSIGFGKRIFIGSSVDMFADGIPEAWIADVIRKIRLNSGRNSYLFQTKNPKRINEFALTFPMDVVMGTTLESNRNYTGISKAPGIEDRVTWMEGLRRTGFETMISIEPILDFDLNHFIQIVEGIKPAFVSIGADSKGHQLPEPSAEKTKKLIEQLKKITEVRIKDNLRRLI